MTILLFPPEQGRCDPQFICGPPLYLRVCLNEMWVLFSGCITTFFSSGHYHKKLLMPGLTPVTPAFRKLRQEKHELWTAGARSCLKKTETGEGRLTKLASRYVSACWRHFHVYYDLLVHWHGVITILTPSMALNLGGVRHLENTLA